MVSRVPGWLLLQVLVVQLLVVCGQLAPCLTIMQLKRELCSKQPYQRAR